VIYNCHSKLQATYESGLETIKVPKNFNVIIHTKFGEAQYAPQAINMMTLLKEGKKCNVKSIYYAGELCPEVIFRYGANPLETDHMTLAFSSKTTYKINLKHGDFVVNTMRVQGDHFTQPFKLSKVFE
jgi:hypothetical protein